MPDFPGMLARRRERAREIVTGLLDTPLGPGSRSDVRDLPGLLSDIVQGPVRSVGSDLFGSISAADVVATDRARVQAGGESQLMRAPGTGFRTDLLGRMVPVPEATPEQEQLAFDAVTGLIPGGKAATGAIGGIFAGQGARLADLTRWADAKRAVRTGELRNTNQLLPPKQIPPGQRPEVVRRETGWFRGKDGLWRFEIDDSQATINFGAFGTPGVRNVRADDMFKELGVQPGDEVALLGELLDHPTLYENYPHLRNTEVRLRAGMPNESLGGYTPTGDGRGIIELNKERFTEELNPRVRRNQLAAVGDDRKLGATARAADNLLSTLIHETQHAVQDFEGFAGGGNMRAIGEELMRRTLPESVLRAGMDLKNKAKASGITNIDDFDEDVVGAVLASKGIPTFSIKWRNMVKRLALTSDDELAEQLRMTRGARNPELWFRTYQRLAGEAEARNVSARRHLNVVERNLLSPTREGPPRAADIVMRANREGVEFPRNLPEGSLDVSQRSQILPSQLNLPRPDPGTTPPAVRSPMIMEEAVRPGLLQDPPPPLEGQRISPRFPTAKKATEDPLQQDLPHTVEALRRSPGKGKNAPTPYEKNTELLARGLTPTSDQVKKRGADPLERISPEFRVARGMSPDELAAVILDHFSDNIISLYEITPPHIASRSALWYPGANRLATELTEPHGFELWQGAGVLSALSPQKDWNENISLARRVISIFTDQQSAPWTTDMTRRGREVLTSRVNKPLLRQIQGKRLDQLEDPMQRAAWIRVYDQTFNAPSFELYTPEGDSLGLKLTQGAGQLPAMIRWGSTQEISNAVRVLEGQNPALLFGQAKQRNFYNNIVDPSHPFDLTADTHAVAAAHIKPLSGTRRETSAAFGTLKGIGGSTVTGVQGTYPFYADGYRLAASEIGLRPLQTQSITWDTMRAMYPRELRGDNVLLDRSNKIWNDYARGIITAGEARSELYELVGGYRPPDWFR